MKTYTVNYMDISMYSIDIQANSEKEAIELAMERANTAQDPCHECNLDYFEIDRCNE